MSLSDDNSPARSGPVATPHSINKALGSELIINYIAQIVKIQYTRDEAEQLTKHGNTQIKTQLLFRPNTERENIVRLYPGLLSNDEYLIIFLSCFNSGNPSARMYEEWYDYIHITAPFHSTSLRFQSNLDRGAASNAPGVKIAMPRDFCIEP